MNINPSDPTPAYLQIAEALRRRITNADLPDGAALPSVRQLVEEFGTAAGTVRQALSQLTSEGLVVARQGSGVFVRKARRLERVGTTRHRRSLRPERTTPLQAEAAAQSFRRSSQLIEVVTVTAPLPIAERLHLTEDAPVIRRRYHLSLDDEIAQTAASYFPPEIAHGTALADASPLPGGTHAYLIDELGIPLDVATEELVARMPTHPETVTLRLLPGTPVVEMLRTIYNTTGKPVEVTVFLFAADRHRFIYTVPMT